MHQTRQNVTCYTNSLTIPTNNRIPECTYVKKKRQRFPKQCLTSQNYLVSPFYNHTSAEEVLRQPLSQLSAKLMCAERSCILRSANPCPNIVHMEPLPPWSSEVMFEYLLLPPRSAPSAISYRLSPQTWISASIPSYASCLNDRYNRLVSATRFSAIHFQG